MNMLAEVYANIDNTIPIWGVLVAMVFGAFYIVKMKFEVDQLRTDMTQMKKTMEKDMTELKGLIHECILDRNHYGKHK